MLENPEEDAKAISLLIAFVSILVLLAVVFVLFRRFQKWQFATWRSFAEGNAGFTYEGDGLFASKIKGAIDGVSLRCGISTSGPSNDRSHRTVFSASLPFVPPGNLELLPETLFEKLHKAFGGRDIQIGDPSFDRKVVVCCDLEDSARALLSSELRSQYLDALKKEPTLRVEGSKVKVIHKGVTTNPQKIASAFETLTLVTNTLSKAHQSLHS